MTSYSQLSDQLAQLQTHRRYLGATLRPFDHGHLVTLPDVTLPVGWTHKAATVMFYVGPGYPCQRPEHFWTVETVNRLSDYGPLTPQLTRSALDDPRHPAPATQKWLWHPTHWSANDDTLLTYANVIRMRFTALR